MKRFKPLYWIFALSLLASSLGGVLGTSGMFHPCPETDDPPAAGFHPCPDGSTGSPEEPPSAG